MLPSLPYVSIAIFGCVLVATFGVSLAGGRSAKNINGAGLSEQRLNKWLVGLSAGATANSGFIVTGSVGLGYTQGMQWLMLPIAWLIGDIVFWAVFPARINRIGATLHAETMADIITGGFAAKYQRMFKLAVAAITLTCLSGYLAAQWLAGEKFLLGAFGFQGFLSVLLFSLLIIIYTALGGFRGSIYVDSFQAIIRLFGTAIAGIAVVAAAVSAHAPFWDHIGAAGPGFLNLTPGGALLSTAGFVLGFAAAALGFSLGQPQMITRYLAGSSPEETRSAWWIYMGFVQSTWVIMILFGILLRGVMPGLADPETGLSAFFRWKMGPILTGIIAADVFATIAATSNSLLVTLAQTAKYDLFNSSQKSSDTLWPFTLGLGLITMVLSLTTSHSVVGMVFAAISVMGATLAPVMIVRLLGWRYTVASLAASMATGGLAAVGWMMLRLDLVVNSALPGIAAGLITNAVIARFSDRPISLAHGEAAIDR